MDVDRALREEVRGLWDRVEVIAPLILRPRRSWLSRLLSFLAFTVI